MHYYTYFTRIIRVYHNSFLVRVVRFILLFSYFSNVNEIHGRIIILQSNLIFPASWKSSFHIQSRFGEFIIQPPDMISVIHKFPPPTFPHPRHQQPLPFSPGHPFVSLVRPPPASRSCFHYDSYVIVAHSLHHA